MHKKINPFVSVVTITTVILVIVQIFYFQVDLFNRQLDYSYNRPNLLTKTSFSEYVNSEAGFTLEYPSNVVLDNPLAMLTKDKLALSIQVRKISSLDGPLGFDQATAEKDQIALKTGAFGEYLDFLLPPSKEIITIGQEPNEIYGKTFLVFSRFEVCDVTFEKMLVFYNNDYQIVLDLYGEKQKIIDSQPDFFKLDEMCGNQMIWKNADAMVRFFESMTFNKANEPAQKWFETFDEIVSSIKFDNK